MHLTFEEMLAAYGLYQSGVDQSLPLIQTHLTDPAWRETILLAVGVWGLANKNPREAGKLTRAMLAMPCPTDAAAQNVLLAGACLEDVGEAGVGRLVANEVIEALLAASLNRTLPPVTQRDAGFILGRLAGNSPTFLERIRPDLDDWVNIPAGEFLYGDDKRKEVITEPFAIQKYPMTNLQYKRFMDDKGYDHPELWSADGWAWRIGGHCIGAPPEDQDWFANRTVEKRGEPYYWHDEKWNNPLAPAVGISWFEAEACANWLSKQQGRTVRLPTEQEWERAARGVKGREYVWGDAFTGKNLNCAEFWLQDDHLDWRKWFGTESRKAVSVTIVGQFPAGSTPEGVCDLSGNVWEWTDSWYGKGPGTHTARGGSWNNLHRDAHCTCRNGLIPDDYGTYLGFRLVSPGS